MKYTLYQMQILYRHFFQFLYVNELDQSVQQHSSCCHILKNKQDCFSIYIYIYIFSFIIQRFRKYTMQYKDLTMLSL